MAYNGIYTLLKKIYGIFLETNIGVELYVLANATKRPI
jgi:hypothetical protein